MRAYIARGYFTAKSFIKEVLNTARTTKFVVDKVPWLMEALKSLNQ